MTIQADLSDGYAPGGAPGAGAPTPGPADPPPTHPLYARLDPRPLPPRPVRAPRRVPRRTQRRSPVPAPPPRLTPTALRRVLAGGAVLVVGLWLVQAEPSMRLDALFATLAHLSGLLAGSGILVMLLLMARVPAVEHGVGADRLARRHALGGRHVLTLCLAHTGSP
ncbi:hypothetical protein ABZ851_06710 [Streptomyces sp. NPDC047049]|uniref:hypothetical protein n=1 Tax=Streptomyces sp. NPDC047049 TaxID=3156688 RepID=UPI0033DFB832